MEPEFQVAAKKAARKRNTKIKLKTEWNGTDTHVNCMENLNLKLFTIYEFDGINSRPHITLINRYVRI